MLEQSSNDGDLNQMDSELFKEFCKIAYDAAGINLKEGKEALVKARVMKRQRHLGISSPRKYLEHLKADEGGDELVQFLDAIATNFTDFFREPQHFKMLTEVVVLWLAQGQRRFRFWSAASSSGEEPYSIAITLDELFRGQRIDYRILATDISTRVLAIASRGIYPKDRLRSLSKQQLLKYFTRISDPGGLAYQVKPEIKSRLLFKRLNLVGGAMPMKGPLDVVFCRNVMIYFDRPTRQRLVANIEGLIRPSGYFMIGHSETLTGIQTKLRMLRPSVYQKL
jgi:chemotaxis protein methyltransferase CheR